MLEGKFYKLEDSNINGVEGTLKYWVSLEYITKIEFKDAPEEALALIDLVKTSLKNNLEIILNEAEESEMERIARSVLIYFLDFESYDYTYIEDHNGNRYPIIH